MLPNMWKWLQTRLGNSLGLLRYQLTYLSTYFLQPIYLLTSYDLLIYLPILLTYLIAYFIFPTYHLINLTTYLHPKLTSSNLFTHLPHRPTYLPTYPITYLPTYLPTYVLSIYYLLSPIYYNVITYLLPTYLLVIFLFFTSYLPMFYGLQATYLSTPFTYQPSCNLPINYPMFLLTYITNDVKL